MAFGYRVQSNRHEAWLPRFDALRPASTKVDGVDLGCPLHERLHVARGNREIEVFRDAIAEFTTW